jgi:hypothetical protein
MTQEQINKKARRTGREFNRLLGIRNGYVLLFQDGDWVCDPRDKDRPNMKMGFGTSKLEAVEDCRKQNG